jgi:TonB family protein
MNASRNSIRMFGAILVAATHLAIIGVAAEEAIRIPQLTALNHVSSKVAPAYPLVARQLRLAGDLQVDITIDQEGKVEDAKVVKGNSVFSAAAVDAVKKWAFRPIHVQGKVSKVLTTLTFSFKP